MKPFLEKAPAKINLFLHITGRRAGGYHALESLIVFADFGDQVQISPAEDFAFEITGPFAADLHSQNEGDNLVVRAAQGFAALARKPLKLRIVLEKNLPPASGIGGGSSDAAATIRGLEKFWDVKADETLLQALLLRLGADTPVCYSGRSSFVTGLGERVQTIRMAQDIPALVVNPLIPCPTQAVFRAFQASFSPALSLTADLTAHNSLLTFLQTTRNDLSGAALALCPAIGEITAALRAQNGVRFCRMSGSGASVFALFDERTQAAEAAAALRRRHPAWWIRPCLLNPSPR